MDVLLQRHCAKYIYVIPDGLRELMSDISREVLRSQPTEIYTFIADYLDALLITRENARVAAKLVESITAIAVTIADLLSSTGMSREEADRLATIIQTTFRKYLNSKLEKEKAEEASVVSEILETAELPPEQEAKAAVIIQRAYRSFREKREKEKEMLIGMIDWRIAARSAIYLYRKTGVTPEEANRAATFIKSAYKGYYTRRVMTRLVEESQEYHAGDDYEEDGRWQEEEEGGMQEDDGRTQEEEVEVDVVAGEGDSFSIKEKNVRINYDTIIPRVDFDYEAKAVVTDDFSEDVVIHDDDTFEPVDSAAFVTSVMDNLLSSVFSDGGSEGRRRRRSYDVGSGLESVGEVIEEESET